MLFVAEVAATFGSATAVGRAAPEGAGADFELPGRIGLAPLPYYENLRRLGGVVRALRGTLGGMWRALADVDVVLVFGPHPLALAFALLALVRRRRVVLGIRQDTMSYFRARLPGRGWTPVLAPLWVLDRCFRLLARFVPAIVVGHQLERMYGGPRSGLMRTTISLSTSAEINARPDSGELPREKGLLAAGRIEPEKNPFLLVDALAELERRRPGEFAVTWAGTGRLVERVEAHAAEAGVADRVALVGFVPYGPALLDLYRDADVFVHVSLTEGSPQVLVEAMAAATPIVATDVGSVGETLEGGAAGLLVPPNDRDALVAAILELCDDPVRREGCVARGREIARRHARDVEAGRVAAFIVGEPADRP